MFFSILATFAEFEVDLLRMRTREGMAIAKAKGNLNRTSAVGGHSNGLNSASD
jgi:DNA invertase Pin-like site-specific DNA recombinase